MLRLFEEKTIDHDRALGSNYISKLFDDFRFVSDVYCLNMKRIFQTTRLI